MTIAIIADIHLRTRGDCPERCNVLVNILKSTEALIIAGDLFDKEYEYEIDQLVYQLYGLTSEEIAVVEGENGQGARYRKPKRVG